MPHVHWTIYNHNLSLKDYFRVFWLSAELLKSFHCPGVLRTLEYGKKKTDLATTQTPNIPRYGFTIYYTLYKHRENNSDTIRSMKK